MSTNYLKTDSAFLSNKTGEKTVVTPPLIEDELTITENGTYNAPIGKGYTKVNAQISGLPDVTSEDNGNILIVKNGEWGMEKNVNDILFSFRISVDGPFPNISFTGNLNEIYPAINNLFTKKLNANIYAVSDNETIALEQMRTVGNVYYLDFIAYSKAEQPMDYIIKFTLSLYTILTMPAYEILYTKIYYTIPYPDTSLNFYLCGNSNRIDWTPFITEKINTIVNTEIYNLLLTLISAAESAPNTNLYYKFISRELAPQNCLLSEYNNLGLNITDGIHEPLTFISESKFREKSIEYISENIPNYLGKYVCYYKTNNSLIKIILMPEFTGTIYIIINADTNTFTSLPSGQTMTSTEFATEIATESENLGYSTMYSSCSTLTPYNLTIDNTPITVTIDSFVENEARLSVQDNGWNYALIANFDTANQTITVSVYSVSYSG